VRCPSSRIGLDHDSDEIAEIVQDAYRLVAPKRLQPNSIRELPPARRNGDDA